MHVLVVGGTGFIGRYLCYELVDRDHDVTALSRSPDDDAVPDPVETVSGDVTDPDSIAPAFEGQDAVVNLVSLSPLYQPKGGNEMHAVVHLGGTRNCVQAAEGHGVERFVQMSALGADPDAPTHFLRSKGDAETVVRESDLEHVILRPSVVFGDGDEFVDFTTGLKRTFAPGLPLYPLPGGGDLTKFQPIYVEDFAPMIADCVEADEHVGETYEIGGPAVYTLREITNHVYESKGKSVRIVPLPMALAKVGLTVLGAAGFKLGRDQYRSLRIHNVTDDNDVGAFGVDPAELTTFPDYLGLERDGDDR